MPGQGGRFGGHPLHHVTIAADNVGAVIHDGMPRPIENGGQVPFSHGHAHGVGKALPQRPGGGLHTGRVAIFGVAGSLAAPLAKIADLFQAEIVTGQVQQAVEQHGGVTGGEDESVAIRPVRVFGVVLHHLCPQHITGRSQTHGCSRVAGIGLLHRIHGQGADRVDAKIIDVRLRLSWLLAHADRLLVR